MLKQLKPFAVFIALGCMFALGNPARATLTSASDLVFGSDSLVIDSETNLQWLKLGNTGDRSFNDMVGSDGTNEFATGGSFAGFRYATRLEVETLFLHAGIPSSAILYGVDASNQEVGTFQTSDQTAVQAAVALQELVGYYVTDYVNIGMQAGAWMTQALAWSPAAEGLSMPHIFTCEVGTGFCGGSSLPLARISLEYFGPGFTGFQDSLPPIIGYAHWLVREASIPVSEPSTLLLLAASLFWMGASRRLDKRACVQFLTGEPR